MVPSYLAGLGDIGNVRFCVAFQLSIYKQQRAFRLRFLDAIFPTGIYPYCVSYNNLLGDRGETTMAMGLIAKGDARPERGLGR
jgi:hypothetical protein